MNIVPYPVGSIVKNSEAGEWCYWEVVELVDPHPRIKIMDGHKPMLVNFWFTQRPEWLFDSIARASRSIRDLLREEDRGRADAVFHAVTTTELNAMEVIGIATDRNEEECRAHYEEEYRKFQRLHPEEYKVGDLVTPTLDAVGLWQISEIAEGPDPLTDLSSPIYKVRLCGALPITEARLKALAIESRQYTWYDLQLVHDTSPYRLISKNAL